eukprot:NODE_234_length_12000_cov_0.516343.p6 type:complete len:227 gc:universal NODE_234_length_12000_cov_0.516343:1688-1008(-)
MLIALLLATSISIDCPVVLKLARQLNFKQKYTTIYQQMEADCCSTPGITCQNDRVTELRWTSTNGYSMQSSSYQTVKEPNTTIYVLPPYLQVLDSNQFYGGLMNEIPFNMTYLQMTTSYVTLNVTEMPQSLNYVYLGFSKLIQDTKWPDSLTTLKFDKMVTKLPDWPMNLTFLGLADCLFTDVLPELPPKIDLIGLERNSFSGSLTLKTKVTSIYANYNNFTALYF